MQRGFLQNNLDSLQAIAQRQVLWNYEKLIKFYLFDGKTNWRKRLQIFYKFTSRENRASRQDENAFAVMQFSRFFFIRFLIVFAFRLRFKFFAFSNEFIVN